MKANSKNQLLVHHLISVGELAKLSISKINFDENIINKEDMAKMSFLAGLFHDIGKIDPSFQLFINKKNEFDEDFEQSFDGYHQDTDILESRATHNELSWAILTSFNITINGKSINKPTFIQYAVYWHHKKLIRKDDGKFDNNISI
jgi:CRISPR-associated endonuclease/helicase Cas3